MVLTIVLFPSLAHGGPSSRINSGWDVVRVMTQNYENTSSLRGFLCCNLRRRKTLCCNLGLNRRNGHVTRCLATDFDGQPPDWHFRHHDAPGRVPGLCSRRGDVSLWPSEIHSNGHAYGAGCWLRPTRRKPVLVSRKQRHNVD